jgi:peptide/nickel transport system substrate-binding protein
VLAAQIIQANLADVGIDVKVLPLDSGPFWDMGQESKGEDWKDLQIWLMRFGGSPDPHDMAQWFVRDQVGIWNWERWSDDEFEDLYVKGQLETDTQKRHDIYLRMQEIMDATGAYVWIGHEPEVFAHRGTIMPMISAAGEEDFARFTGA